MKALILFVFVLFLLPGTLFSQYIVDQRSEYDCEEADGTEEKPWKGFDCFDINTLEEGSIIYVKPGVYSEGHSNYGGNAIIWIKKNNQITIIADEGDVTLDGSSTTRYGILLFTETNQDTVYSIEIDGIEFIDFEVNAIKVRGYAGTPKYFIDDVRILNCTIQNTVGDTGTVNRAGIILQLCKNIAVDNCTINQIAHNKAETDGIYIDDSEDITITNSYIYLYNDSSTAHIDCIQATRSNNLMIGTKNITIENNFLINRGHDANSVDDDRQGIHIFTSYGNVNIKNNNIISAKGKGLINVYLNSSTNNVKIWNNTLVAKVYSTGDGNPQNLVQINDSLSNFIHKLEMKNNIFNKADSSQTNDAIWFVNANFSDLSHNILNHNLYYNSDNSKPTIVTNNGRVSWDSDTSKIENKGIQGNPAFVDISQENYKLNYYSPAKNRGYGFYTAGLNKDYYGNPRPYWNKDFDIGAYEINDAQFKIHAVGMGTNDLLKHTIKSYGAYWQRNSNTTFTVSTDSELDTASFVTRGNAPSNIDAWRGFTYKWIYPATPDSNSKWGAGFYKVSNDSGAYFYLDARDAITGYSPNIYIRYNNDEQVKEYEFFDGNDFIGIVNGSLLRIWNIKNASYNTEELIAYWENALIPVIKNNHPWVVWGPHAASEFIVYRDSSGITTRLDNLNNNVYEYTDESVDLTIIENPETFLARYHIDADSDTTNKVEYYVVHNQPKIASADLIKFDYAMSQNYPNPFNPTTKIRFTLANDEIVNIKLYDALGREVKTLINEHKNKGNYEIIFNASSLSSGVYFYRIEAGKYTAVKKFQLMK
jgi:hypothetical protein